MTTVLQYLVIAAVIGLVVFGLAVFVFGRGEQLAPLSPRTSPTELPDNDLSAQDVRQVRFAMALRGYRMSDVDWALEKMAAEIDRLRAEVGALSGSTESVDRPDHDSPDHDSPDHDSPDHDSPDHDSPDHDEPDHHRPDHHRPDHSDPVLAAAPGGGGRHEQPDSPAVDAPSQKET